MFNPEVMGSMPWKTVKQLWKDLHTNPDLREYLRPEIHDSWERSYHCGVSPSTREFKYFCSEADFKEALTNSKCLMETAIPIMERLSEFLKGSGFAVILGDANCIMLKVIGDKEVLDWAKKANVIDGTVWTEEKVGTNPGPLCISLVKPIAVYSYEYFCFASIFGASSAAPIIDNGRIIGSLSMSAPYERVNRHTLGMVVSAVDHIQSTLVLNRISKYYQVLTDSISEAVMVVNSTGTITYMNKNCFRLFEFGSAVTVESNIYTVFGKNPKNQLFISIVTQGRTVIDEHFVLYYGNNQLHCQITCTPLDSSNPFDKGAVIVLRESERINRIIGKWIGRSAKMTFDDIIGESPVFQEIINIARITAQSDSNVLLLGESGTGKDVIAQAMHNESPRKNNPFLAINCAALPRDLIASELFGYEEGAFTGAKKGGNVGKFELANQGTLFLDEIGDVPVELQVSLLRVLDEKSIIRLGGNKLVPVNVRIIAATNKNLEEEIAQNRFRSDLFYRLGVIKLNIPPLRERRDDIPLLVEYFLRIICNRFGKPLKKMTPAALQGLISYEWPGNIRELQNVVEGSVQLVTGLEIDYSFLSSHLELKVPPSISNADIGSDLDSANEIEVLQDVLLKNKFNISKTAKELGMSRQSLYRRLHKYNLR